MEAAFHRAAGGLYRFVLVRAGHDASCADDLMQQLWMRASRDSLRLPPDRAERWLRTVARNLLAEHWRRAGRRPVTLAGDSLLAAEELAQRIDSHPIPPELLSREETKRALLLVMTELSDEEQELLIARYQRQTPLEEIAREQGTSIRAIEGKLYRLRATLRSRLAPSADSEEGPEKQRTTS